MPERKGGAQQGNRREVTDGGRGKNYWGSERNEAGENGIRLWERKMKTGEGRSKEEDLGSILKDKSFP